MAIIKENALRFPFGKTVCLSRSFGFVCFIDSRSKPKNVVFVIHFSLDFYRSKGKVPVEEKYE